MWDDCALVTVNDLQNIILKEIATAQPFQKLVETLAEAKAGKAIAVKGLRASALGGVAAALAARSVARPPLIVLITSNYEHAGEIYDDLQFFGLDTLFHYPKSQVLPYEEEEPLLEEQIKHLEFLHHLAHLPTPGKSAPSPVCVVPVEALFIRVAPLDILRGLTMRVEWGEPLNTEQFGLRAAELGFERVPTVEARGEFAIRGGIIDIFPLDTNNPLRIDLFGNDIESMRWFDVHTQRSLKGGDNIESITILPARERALIEKALEAGDRLPPLLELLPEGSLLLLDSPESFPLLDERFQQLTKKQFDTHHAGNPDIPEPATLFATLGDIQKASGNFVQVHHTLVSESVQRAGTRFDVTSFETVKPSLEHYITQIRKRLADSFTVVLVCDNEGQVDRMDEMLRENEIGAVKVAKDGKLPPLKGGADVILITGLLHSGFVFGEANLYIVTDREIFGRYKRRHIYRKIYKGTPIADAREIRKGDFVVHVEHGIGRFEGLRSQTVDNRVTDFVELIYADNDKLLIPIEKIAYIQKFSAGEQAPPTLDKLGSKKWVQRKKKSQEDIEKLAHELLVLYARRATARGYAYGGDTVWQREFESSFLYTETPDQLRAITDVKSDMAADKPMDRLVCGDVGYGKTEVAIRAAFKAIMDHKQVALLCPTTILARQHYDNFRERFADYPIRVDMLSRFRTAKESKDTMRDLTEGKVNMVIGTHMLLSKSVQFKDLGLVIVDEEQRFGVTHKDKLKEMRASVDFLTLTATPIPRTLYMALSGLRDMSVINTPPADRHPIKTRIIHWDRGQIEEAILRELNRGGQVFFVHNRVQNIHQIADKVKEIVPSARIAIGHGQMNEHELEQVMLDFIDRKFDILVSTTIIESGLDIPNCNTIIVNRADAFGLAQLYQLRGRVGRENRRAYAYLIVPAGQAITEQAVARLSAIEEFTELGVGFNIAMRDMEIRGTGNLLGKEQHGTMNAIGFELYCRMLEDAVTTLRGEQPDIEDTREVEIQWKASAYIPPSFVPVESQRVMMYKKIAEAKTLADLDAIADEMKDRYGEVNRSPGDKGAEDKVIATNAPVATTGKKSDKPGRIVEDLPESVENLFAVSRLRILGRKLNIRKISATLNGFKVYRDNAVRELGPAVSAAIKGEIPKVYTDDLNALDFFYSDWKVRPQLAEAAKVLGQL